MITNIKIDKLYPHPDNPRKDMGDLKELTASIRENGILQNLTVVPAKGKLQGDYYVVIGNRRLAAGLKAGLKEMPCLISDMNEKKQIATMLLENIQRSDLTPYEQAQGFQMMLDLGETVASIAKSTGFSQTTVRHRVKLLDLDPELLRERSAQNINMFDLIKLEQIKDKEQKNEALSKIGTDDFNYTYNRIIKGQEEKEWLDSVEKTVAKFAAKIDEKDDSHEYVTGYNKWNMEKEVVTPEGGEFFYTRTNDSVTVYTMKQEAEHEETEEEKAKKAWREEVRTKREKLKSIRSAMFETRSQFIKKLGAKELKKHSDMLLNRAVLQICTGDSISEASLNDFLGITMPEELQSWQTEYKEIKAQKVSEVMQQAGALKVLAVAVYAGCENKNADTTGWNGSYTPSEPLNRVYDFLSELGYKMSDEEKSVLNGSHELYMVYPEEPEDAEDTEGMEYVPDVPLLEDGEIPPDIIDEDTIPEPPIPEVDTEEDVPFPEAEDILPEESATEDTPQEQAA